MTNTRFFSARPWRQRFVPLVSLAVSIAFLPGLSVAAARAQADVGGGDAGACTLKNHVYTCDGAALQKALAAANTIMIETHNADGVARAQLISFITKKLGKTVAAPGTPADLDFLLIPVAEASIDNVPGNSDLGTLRIYTVTPDGGRGHLLWAETYSGDQDTPWPAVVRSVILRFQSRFHIK